jgi:hypothetical protein
MPFKGKRPICIYCKKKVIYDTYKGFYRHYRQRVPRECKYILKEKEIEMA